MKCDACGNTGRFFETCVVTEEVTYTEAGNVQRIEFVEYGDTTDRTCAECHAEVTS